MFDRLRVGHRVAAMGWRWTGCTGIDLRDNQWVFKTAVECIEAVNGVSPEDAWLMALVTWMNENPWPDSRLMIAHGIVKFLDAFEGKVQLSATAVTGARESAQHIELMHQLSLEKQESDTRETLLHTFNSAWDKAWKEWEDGDIEYEEMRDQIRESVIANP